MRLLPLVLLFAAPAVATGFQNPADIDVRVVAALGAGIGEPGGPMAQVDRRLKLAQCPAPLVVDPPASGAVAVRCEALGWRLRVPLVRQAFAGAATAGREAPVIRRGDLIDVVAQARGFTVSAQGTAQGDGAPGDRIRVKTDPKNPAVLAEVVGPGQVRISGFN